MPVVTLDYSNTAITDTHIQEGNPTAAGNNSVTINWGVDSNGKKVHGLIKFDIGSIPNDAVINSATLNLYHPSIAGIEGRPNSFHKVTEDWIAGVTWNTRPAFDLVPTITKAPTKVGVNSYDLKSLVQSWINGTSQNFGILIKDADESINGTAR